MLLLQSATSVRSLPDGFCMFATPGEHSRKPGLGSVLAPHLPPQPRCAEVGCQSHLQRLCETSAAARAHAWALPAQLLLR